MAAVNERLREAARTGSTDKLKALLWDPESDALSRCAIGMTALMWAAGKGHEACVRLLLPTSDTGATDNREMTALAWAALRGHEACVKLLLPASDPLAKVQGLTASAWARTGGSESLAQFIDAYVLAQSERQIMTVAVCSGAPPGRAAPRV